MKEHQQQIKGSRHDEHLKMLLECELIESYNRRDNGRIIGLKGKTKTDNKNRIKHESLDEPIDKFVKLSKKHEKVLSLLCLNARSLNKHLHDLEALVFCLESPPLVLHLTKIWLKK